MYLFALDFYFFIRLAIRRNGMFGLFLFIFYLSVKLFPRYFRYFNGHFCFFNFFLLKLSDYCINILLILLFDLTYVFKRVRV